MVSNAATKLLRAVSTFTKSNSPLLTTVVGASGVVAVAVLAAQAGAKAERRLRANWNHPEDASAKDRVQETWREYIPTAIAAGVTIGAIVTGHRVNATRAAATTAALAISERTFNEYRDRIVERLGADDERKIRNEVRQQEQDRQEHTPVIVMGSSSVTCLDMFSGRYFVSDVQTIKAAVNEVNSIIWQQMYCPLTDFYDYLGIPKTGNSDYVGWNADHPLDVGFGTAMTPDDKPCLVVQFTLNPTERFNNFAG